MKCALSVKEAIFNKKMGQNFHPTPSWFYFSCCECVYHQVIWIINIQMSPLTHISVHTGFIHSPFSTAYNGISPPLKSIYSTTLGCLSSKIVIQYLFSIVVEKKNVKSAVKKCAKKKWYFRKCDLWVCRLTFVNPPHHATVTFFKFSHPPSPRVWRDFWTVP